MKKGPQDLSSDMAREKMGMMSKFMEVLGMKRATGPGTKGHIDPQACVAAKAKSCVWLLVADGGKCDALGGDASHHTSLSPYLGGQGRALEHCFALDLEYIAAFCGLLDIATQSRTAWYACDSQRLREMDTVSNPRRVGLAIVMEALVASPDALETLCVWMHETPFISQGELPSHWEELWRECGQTYVSETKAGTKFVATPPQDDDTYWWLMRYGPLSLISAISDGGTHRVHHALASAPHFPELVDRMLQFVARKIHEHHKDSSAER